MSVSRTDQLILWFKRRLLKSLRLIQYQNITALLQGILKDLALSKIRILLINYHIAKHANISSSPNSCN